MTTAINKSRFASFRGELRNKYGEDVYANYFEDIGIDDRHGEKAVLISDNRHVAERIRTEFLSDVLVIWSENIAPATCLDVVEEDSLPRNILSQPEGGRTAAAALKAHNIDEMSAAPVSAYTEADLNPSSETLNCTVNKMQTIDNFCVNDTNRMAYMAAERAVMGDGASVTYIYGKNGYGKSHLLNAACNKYMDSGPARRIMHITYESLVADVSDAVVSRSVKELRAHLMDTDLLVFDDVQLLRGRKRTQEELACLIERFQPLGKPILIAGALSPKELVETGISRRLTDRLDGGTSVRISAPDKPLRQHVAERIAKDFTSRTGIEIPLRHIEFIARRSDVSIREVKGIMSYFTLAIEARQEAFEITDEWVREVLSEKLKSHQCNVTIDDVFQYTASTFGVSVADLRSKSRRRELVRARQAFCLAGRKLTDASLKAIGGMISRDHTTVMHSVDQAEIFAESDKAFGHKINVIFNHFGH